MADSTVAGCEMYMRRLALTTVMVTAIGLLVACACGGDGGGGAGSDRVQAVDDPVTRSSLNDVCDGKVALTPARPFAGPAPHPVQVFSQQQGNDPGGETFPLRMMTNVSPGEARALMAPQEQIQLVACGERVADTPTEVFCRVDPASPVVRDHLAFWAAFAGLQEGDRPDLAILRDRVDQVFLGELQNIVQGMRNRPGESVRGPLHLLVTGVSQENGTVAVDSCVDETERETMQQSEPTGEVGLRHRIRVNLTPAAGSYVATGWADPPPGGCPPPAGRIG
ncbi:hypothetical protein [Parafrankia sp. FMc2]|uniref:hypothetical protein n=1 Tax=Parafrankia sp. FMc2 TaxID=3233196 RepID=UPI0034D73E2A